MLLLDRTLPTAAENVALDEALLDEAESGVGPPEVLRLWEPTSPLVVVGRSSRVESEVDLPRCRGLGIPIIRRTSGGAAIVTGPGCLMYAVVLSTEARPEIKAIDQAHCYVLGRLVEALGSIARVATRCGTSDLAILPSPTLAQNDIEVQVGAKKFSGNSLRVKRRHLLYHGTLLFDFDLRLISACLQHPPREPEYRAGRTHDAFITNLPATGAQLRAALVSGWDAFDPLPAWPQQRTAELVAEKYARDAWNLQAQTGP